MNDALKDASEFDALVVGAGFAGSVCARELADAGWSVLVVDSRPHIGGNAFDTREQASAERAAALFGKGERS